MLNLSFRDPGRELGQPPVSILWFLWAKPGVNTALAGGKVLMGTGGWRGGSSLSLSSFFLNDTPHHIGGTAQGEESRAGYARHPREAGLGGAP